MYLHIIAAVKAMLKITLVCGLGAYSFRRGMFDQPSIKIMSKLYIQVLFPCLMFTKSIVVFTPSNLPYMGILIALSLLYLGIGHVVGYVIYRVCRKHLPIHFRHTVIPLTAYGNHGDLILSIIASIGNFPPFNRGDDTLGVAYVAIFLVPCSLLMFATAPPFFISDNACLEAKSAKNTEHIPLSRLDSLHDKRPVPHLSKLHSLWSSVKRNPILKAIFNMTTISILLGLILAFIPGVLPFFVPSATAPLSFIYGALEFMGSAAVPLNLTLFGASLTTLETDRQMIRRFPGIPLALILILIFRLLLMPLLGIALIEIGLVRYLQWVPHELKMLRFVLMIEAGVPTAQIVLIMSQYYNPKGEAKEVASVMLVQYFACFFSLTASLSLVLNFLSD